MDAASEALPLPPVSPETPADSSTLAPTGRGGYATATYAHPERGLLPDGTQRTWKQPGRKQKNRAMVCVALRQNGASWQDIANHLKCTTTTVKWLLYMAGREGWCDIGQVQDEVDFNLLPRAVKRLYDSLASEDKMRSGMKVGDHVALEIAKNTVFKSFDQPSAPTQQTAVMVQIQMPEGPLPTVRADTCGGVPAVFDVVPK